MSVAWLWAHRTVVARAAAIAAAAGVVWWFGCHIPSQRDHLQARNRELAAQVEAGRAAVQLQEAIQHEKQQIDTITQGRISSIRARPKPARHGVLVPAGRLPDLPALQQAGPAH